MVAILAKGLALLSISSLASALCQAVAGGRALTASGELCEDCHASRLTVKYGFEVRAFLFAERKYLY